MAEEKRYAVRPIVKLEVNHRDVTADFSDFIQSFTFTDHVKGQADGLQLTLADPSSLWLDAWYPIKGTTVSAWVGFEGQPLLSCGEFFVDEIEIQSPPQEVTIRALGTSHLKALRTKSTRAYEGRSLKALAQDFADRHSLTLVGDVPDVTWRRITQHHETDLAFLRRLGEEHGVVFTIKGESLVFHDVAALEAQAAILQLHPSDCTRWHTRDKVSGMEGGSSVQYFNGDLKELQAVEVLLDAPSPGVDKGKQRRRTESRAQGQRLARAAIRVKHGYAREGTFTVPGDVRLVAGGNIELVDFGALDGLWAITGAKHRVERHTGYTTEVEARYVQH